MMMFVKDSDLKIGGKREFVLLMKLIKAEPYFSGLFCEQFSLD